MIDPFGTLLRELRDDPVVAALTDRVRGEEPAPGDSGWTTDEVTKRRRFANRFIVMTTLATLRRRRIPVAYPRFAVRCYGYTPQDAMALGLAASDAIHDAGPRITSGVGIYLSWDATGLTADRDPDTQQPYATFIIQAIAATQAVAS